jgi:hypothetical protein
MSATLLGLLLLAGLTTLLGRLAARIARVTWLDRTHPDALPLQAALGTALLTCLCAAASHAGLGQASALWIVAVGSVALAAGALRCGPALTQAGRRPLAAGARLSAWLPLMVAMGVAAAAALLPVLRFGSFNTLNDAFAYDAVADWLVGHGVGEVAPRDSMLPALKIVAQMQESGLRLGTSYLQAFVAAALRRPHALLVFYAVSCWGFLLLAALVFCLGRRVFRLSPWLCTAAVCTLVCIPAGNAQALQSGFQAQPCGLSALLALLCATARMSGRRARAVTGGGFVLGALLAWQASAYSELLPVAGVVMLVWLAVTALRAARRGRGAASASSPARMLAVLAASFLLLGNLEIVRALAAIPQQVRAVVGWHVDASLAGWLALFAGTAVHPALPGLERVVPPMALLVPSVLVLALALGSWFFGGGAVARGPRAARPLLHTTRAAVIVLLLMVVHFAFLAEDPWTGKPPHTWSLYKLSQWLHPLVVVSAWAGARRLLRGSGAPAGSGTPAGAGTRAGAGTHARSRARVAAVFVLVVLAAGVPIHLRYAEVNSFRQMSGFAGSERPLAELERLSDGMAGLGDRQFYVVTRPHLTEPRFVELLGFFTIHARAAGLWTDCTHIYKPGIRWMRPELTDIVPPGPLTLLCHAPHFPIAGGQELGCQVVAVPVSDTPVLCQVANANGLERSDGQPFLWIGGEVTTLVVFAPRAGIVRLSFESRRGPALGAGACHLLLTRGRATEGTADDATDRATDRMTDHVTDHATIDMAAGDGTRVVSLEIGIMAGVNEITLACTEAPRHGRPQGPDERPLLLSFSEPRLAYR